jgi:hypothetical protein
MGNLENASSTSPFRIRCQQFHQNLLIGQIALPIIGGKDSVIEPFVSQIQPGGTLIVQIRKRALFLLGLAETFSI